MATRTLERLGEGAAGRLEEIGYAPITIKHYKEHFKAFARYAEGVGESDWSEGLVRGYILERYGLDFEREKLPQHIAQVKRACWMLGFYAATGEIPGRYAEGRAAPARFRPLLELFIAECVERGLSTATLSSRHDDTCDLLDFLDRNGIRRLSDIGRDEVELFMAERHAAAPKAMQRTVSSIRCFLRCMYSHGITERDISLIVPKASRYPSKSLTKVWSEQEVSTLLNSIGRADAPGKRDYAMVLLVATYGLRSGDVVGMRLADISWKSGTLHVVQGKTGAPNDLPMTDEVGWALADWLRNGRPAQPRCDNVFTRLTAPFGPIAAVDPVLKRRMAAAGISRDPNAKSGPHSLRHTVATGMLRAGATVPVISSVLGHSAETTTVIYLHSDIEGLRRCALGLEGVEHGR